MLSFYLKYYLEITHILTFILFLFIFLLGGINLLSPNNFIITIFIVIINAPVSNLCLKLSGLEKAIKQIKEKKSNKK